MTWLLENLDKSWEDDSAVHEVDGVRLRDWAWDHLGHCVAFGPLEGHTKLDFTGPPGTSSSIYFSLVFQLPKWEMKVAKFDEAIEVTPVHAQYYQLTTKQKEELENKIKTGLGQVAQSISDYELLRHDARKYQEFLNYFEGKDEHSLKAVFIDQVDMHTGDVAMRNIVQRWPTLIHDFQRLTDEDLEVDKVKERLKVSKAEAIVLITKNKLYQEWKKLFMPEVKGRLGRIQSLIAGREKSIDEYRDWLRPYIARFRMMQQKYETQGNRALGMRSFVIAGFHAVSESWVKVWAWRDFQPAGLKRAAPEHYESKVLDPYDAFVKAELIWNPSYGLIKAYPWLTPSWVDATAKWIKKEWLVNFRHYYSFLEIKFDRSNVRLADGSELENGVFHVNAWLFSQNVMLVKLLELKAKEQELERYINELMGLPAEPQLKPGEKIPRPTLPARYRLPKALFRMGPYESNLNERLAKFYLKPMAEGRYLPVVGFVKEKMKFGEV